MKAPPKGSKSWLHYIAEQADYKGLACELRDNDETITNVDIMVEVNRELVFFTAMKGK